MSLATRESSTLEGLSQEEWNDWLDRALSGALTPGDAPLVLGRDDDIVTGLKRIHDGLSPIHALRFRGAVGWCLRYVPVAEDNPSKIERLCALVHSTHPPAIEADLERLLLNEFAATLPAPDGMALRYHLTSARFRYVPGEAFLYYVEAACDRGDYFYCLMVARRAAAHFSSLPLAKHAFDLAVKKHAGIPYPQLAAGLPLAARAIQAAQRGSYATWLGQLRSARPAEWSDWLGKLMDPEGLLLSPRSGAREPQPSNLSDTNAVTSG